MSELNVPMPASDLALLGRYAEEHGTTAGNVVLAEAEELLQRLRPVKSRQEIEDEFRRQLADLSPEGLYGIDPELEAITGIITKEIPEDYWGIVTERYL